MITNIDFVKNNITNNLEYDQFGDERLEPVSYRWSHGATDFHLGDGILVYSLIQYMRAKVCVCLGSGGGFIPRIMTQARLDLHSQQIFEGDSNHNWGDIGVTYVVDAMNGIGGKVDWFKEESFFRRKFIPRVLNTTTQDAFYNFFVKQEIKIDYLHIDAGHSYENVKEDFELYTQLLSDKGIVSIHDTDKNYQDNFFITHEVKESGNHENWTGPIRFTKEIDVNKWEVLNLFNHNIIKNKPSSTGFTIIRKK